MGIGRSPHAWKLGCSSGPLSFPLKVVKNLLRRLYARSETAPTVELWCDGASQKPSEHSRFWLLSNKLSLWEEQHAAIGFCFDDDARDGFASNGPRSGRTRRRRRCRRPARWSG